MSTATQLAPETGLHAQQRTVFLRAVMGLGIGLALWLSLFVATMALSTVLDGRTARALPTAAAVFVVARLAFWIGYRKHSLWRAPGMAATAMQSHLILLYALYRILGLWLGA